MNRLPSFGRCRYKTAVCFTAWIVSDNTTSLYKSWGGYSKPSIINNATRQQICTRNPKKQKFFYVKPLSTGYCSMEKSLLIAIIRIPGKSSGVQSAHGCVVVLGGRQPACVLRLALHALSSPPFLSWILKLAIVWILIMGRTACVGKHRGPQFKLECLAVYDSEGAVAVV